MAEQPARESPVPSLWRNAGFVRLWFAQIVSSAGTVVTGLALPLTAILILNATVSQMSFLSIAGSVPPLLFSLFAGVWVDRSRRRPILVGADLGRAVLLGSIPLAAFFGVVTFAHLYVVAFAVSTLSAISSLASLAILPALVPRSQLVEANSRLATTDAVLAIAAPSVAGGLIQVVSAPKAILADAISYVLSALTLRRLSVVEAARRARDQHGAIWREMGEGMQELVRTPALRALTLAVSVGTFGTAMQGTVSFLFSIRVLGFGPTLIGLVGACAGIGSLGGAASAGRATTWLGIGPAVIIGNLLWAVGTVAAPLARPGASAFFLVGAGAGMASFGASLWGVGQMSLRQAITPPGLIARATAARRLPMFGMQIAGAALAGVLGTTLGLRSTLLIGALGLFAGCALLAWSPIRRIHDLASVEHGGRA